MAEADELKSDMESFKKSVNDQLEGVKQELRELTNALRELIRIDGDIKRVQDAMSRIGHQVDDHETRLRNVESDGAVNTTRLSTAERAFWLAIMFALGILQYTITH